MKIIMSLMFVILSANFVWADDGEVVRPGEVIEYDGETLSFGDQERVTETLECPAGKKPVVKCEKVRSDKPRRKKCPGQRTCNGLKGKFCWPKDRRCPIS